MTQPTGATATTSPAVRDRPLYLAAIVLSAFLLFSLELLSGRLVLPVFGGSPGVWTTALCFFTGIVFVGYVYAHLVATRLSPRAGAAVHVTVALAAIAGTLLAPANVAGLRMPGVPEPLNVLLALLLLAGPAAFLCSTTSPLLSSWFAASGRDPWWLYAASNGASFAGLLAYPFLLEPALPLSVQRNGVAVLLAIFTILLVVLASLAARRRPAAPAAADAPRAARIGRRRALRWLFGAMVPAGLLSATTTFLATDLISAPLLWIGPLGIYLLSMVVAFSARGRQLLPVIERLVPAASVLLWAPFVLPFGWPLLALLGAVLGSYGVLATAVHGRVAMDRPEEGSLTVFYVILSAGGVLATGLVALVAPLVFSTIAEYPLLLVASLAALALFGVRFDATAGSGSAARLWAGARARLIPFAVAATVLVALVVLVSGTTIGAVVAGLLVAGAVVIALARSAILLAGATAGVILVLTLTASTTPLVRQRTFFGITVVTNADGPAHAEFSGTTLHGLQFLGARSNSPTTYYVASGPVGDAIADLRARTAKAEIGVVGLGAGTIATYGQPGDAITFYEIDPAVIAIANDPRWFTNLRDSAAATSVVQGDARLSLATVADHSFDLLVLDAFSSDSVPVHLLTAEALALDGRLLKPGGVMVFNVSNRFYDLPGAVVSTARSIGLDGAWRSYGPDPAQVQALAAKPSSWVVVGAPADVARFRSLGTWTDPLAGPVLTDDFANLLSLLRIGR